MTSNLRAIRLSLGMTQRELAAVFGQTAANVSHYENDKQELPPACARALIAAARDRGRDLSFDDIYGGPHCSPQVHPDLGATAEAASTGGSTAAAPTGAVATSAGSIRERQEAA